MRYIVAWSVTHRPVVLLAALMLLGAGVLGATQLRQQLFPDVNFPGVVLTVVAPGLSAGQADEDISDPASAIVSRHADVDSVSARASEGLVQLLVQLEYGADVDAARDDLLAGLRDELELPVGGAVSAESLGFDDQPVVNVAIIAEDLPSLDDAIDDWASDLEGVDGVSRVVVEGLPREQVEVTIRPGELERGLLPPAVAQAIATDQQRSPAGITERDGESTPVVVEGSKPDAIADVGSIKVPIGGSVDRAADLQRAVSDEDAFSRTNGRPSASISVYRDDRANEVQVVEDVDAVLDDVRAQLGRGSVVTILETASDVRASIRGLLIEAGLGAFMAMLVVWALLRSWRATLVVGAAIPTSIACGLLAAWIGGLTLNIITLAGLTVAVGRVIDDGIVVLESIYQRLEQGLDPRAAAVQGTSSVGNAIVASTAATVLVFLPIGLVGGLISEIFLSFSIIVAMALLASLVVAITIVPVLATMLLRADQLGPAPRRLGALIAPVTRLGLRHRGATVVLALLATVSSVAAVGFGLVPVQFLPDSGTPQLYGQVELAPGTTAERARAEAADLERRLRSTEGVGDYQVSYGAGLEFEPGAAPNIVNLYANFDEGADVAGAVRQLRSWGAKRYLEGFSVTQVENGPPSGTFEVTLVGSSRTAVSEAATRLEQRMQGRADVVEVSSDASDLQQQLVVRADPRADPAEVAAVNSTLQAVLTEIEAGELADETPIVVRASDEVTEDPKALGRIRLTGPATEGARASAGAAITQSAARSLQAGGAGSTRGVEASTAMSGVAAASQALAELARPAPAPAIGSIATFTEVESPGTLSRYDGDPAATITGKIEGDDSGATIASLQRVIDGLDVKDVRPVYAGEAEFIAQMFRDLGIAMVVAIVLMLLAMVLFFGSIAHPVTIVAPVLFSTTGGLLALVLTRQALGLPALIGQLLLIGIVVANSILLVDTALRLRAGGSTVEDALQQAASLRVRPVLMTALSTIAALVPLALGVSSEGGLISRSLGTVVIGGLLTATLLTLVIVPAVFSLVESGIDRTRGRD